MATQSFVPWANWRVPALNTVAAYGGTNYMLSPVVGLYGHTEGGGRSGASATAPVKRGRHCLIVSDRNTTSSHNEYGRRLGLWTIGNSDLTANQFHASAEDLRGAPDVDPPDFATMRGYVGMTDGVARAASPGGFGATAVTSGMNNATGSYSNLTGGGLDDGGVFTDETADLAATNQPVPVLPAAPVTNDAFYFGYQQPFRELRTNISTNGAGTWTIVWEYYNGTAWASLPGISDGTSGWTAGSGTRDVTWTYPTDWSPTTVNSTNLFWIRARVSAFTSITTQPVLASAVSFGAAATYAHALNVLSWHGTGATFATGDAFYFGHAQQFTALWTNLSAVIAGTYTVTWEYWTSSGWQSFTPTDNTTSFSVGSAWRKISWTMGFSGVVDVDYSTWATRDLAPGQTAVTSTLYWIRARVATGTPTGNATFAGLGTSGLLANVWVGDTTLRELRAYSPVCYHVPDDPATTAPDIVSWGIALPENIAASSSGTATFWDPVRRIKSRLFTILSSGSTYLAPDHDDALVTHVAIWSSSASTATLLGTIPKGTWAAVTAGTADTGITLGADAGAPTTADETKTGTNRAAGQGTFLSCAVHYRRAWLAGANVADTSFTPVRALENAIIYSERDEFHHFQATSILYVDREDGDHIVGIRSMGDTLVVLKSRSVHFVVGDPFTSATLQVRKVADVGCVALRTAVVIDNAIFFWSSRGLMSISRTGVLSERPHSELLQPIVDGLTQSALANMCAAWNPTEGQLYVAAPGVQAQLVGGAGPNQTVNDALLVWHKDSGNWAIYPGIFALSLATIPANDTTFEVWVGDYWGNVNRFTDQACDGIAGLTDFKGVTATSGGANTLIDGNTTFLVDSTDSRQVGKWVQNLATGEVRMIVKTATNTLTVSPDWTTQPANGNAYRVSAIHPSLITGDLDLGAPDVAKALQRVQLHLLRARDGTDAWDASVDPTDVRDTATAESFASGTLGTGMSPPPIHLPMQQGLTQRLRLLGLQQDQRDRMRGLTLHVNLLGRPRG